VTPSAIDPSRPERVAPALLEYLRAHLDAPRLTFAEAPQEIGDGWETHTYSFRPAGEGLPEPWQRPLILRMYPGDFDRGAERVEREQSIQRFVRARGYPAPLPLAHEKDPSILGLPFMVMERASGAMLMDAMSGRPWRVGGLVLRMVELHVRLHQLDVGGCPLPSEGTLAERKLMEMRALAASLGLGEPEGLAWLEAKKDIVMPEERSVCHNDFHPLNIVIDGEGQCCLIDWSGAAVGDRHCDIATTLVLLRTAPFQGRNLFERLVHPLARWLLVSGYQRRYRRRLPIDTARLRYWEALRAFEWGLFLTAMRVVGPEGIGIKADTADRVPADQIERLQRYFRQRAKG